MPAAPSDLVHAPVRTDLAGVPDSRRRQGLAMAAVVLVLHLLGWGVLVLLVVPQHLGTGTQVFGIGVGVTAYVLGVRHAFDADHIAAIDNTTRKLMAEGQRPVSVGLYFSLGHSTVVLVLASIIAAGVRAVASEVQDEGSALQETTGLIGTAVSGTFLLLIAAFNLVVLVGIVRVFRRMRHGELDEAELERHLDNRGLINRVLGRLMAYIRKPWQMYPVGVLFGLGFDTATEIALLVLAAGAAGAALPWYAVLCLPVIFAAGMSLFDALDSAFMSSAYGWAFTRPVRKIYYNIVVTFLSVAVAGVIGGIEVVQLLADRLDLTGPVWSAVAGVDLNVVGFVVVGLFLLTWGVATAVWKLGHLEQRWTPDPDGPTGLSR